MPLVQVPLLTTLSPTYADIVETAGDNVVRVAVTEVAPRLFISGGAALGDGAYVAAFRAADGSFVGTARFSIVSETVLLPPSQSSRALVGASGDATTAELLSEAGALVEALSAVELGVSGLFRPAPLATSTIGRYLLVLYASSGLPVDLVWCHVGMGRGAFLYVRLTEDGAPSEGITVHVATSGVSAAEGVTDDDGRVALNAARGAHSLIFVRGSELLSPNLCEISVGADNEAFGLPVVVELDLTSSVPAFDPALDLADNAVADLTVRVYGLDGRGKSGVPVVVLVDRPNAAAFMVSAAPVSYRTGADGAASVRVAKGVPFTVFVEGAPVRRYAEGLSADADWLDAGISDTATSSSALPQLPARSI